MLKKIVVASKNPVKVDAVLSGFERVYPGENFTIVSLSVDSIVPDQPMLDEVARQGAENRALQARKAAPDGTYWVGIEGGCDYLDGEMIAFAWIVILANHQLGRTRTAIFRLPREVQRLVETGLELGEADDRVFGKENSKQQSGAVGLLTQDVITRKTLYEQAVILALIPLINTHLY